MYLLAPPCPTNVVLLATNSWVCTALVWVWQLVSVFEACFKLAEVPHSEVILISHLFNRKSVYRQDCTMASSEEKRREEVCLA